MRTALYGSVLAGITLTVGAACAQGIHERETRLSGDAAQALVKGDYARTVELSSQATVLDPKDPWPFYDRASALVELKRTNEAISTFKQAEALFGENHWGQSISIYGRARAHELGGDCAEAARTFEEYAKFVQSTDHEGARLALRMAHECPGREQPAIGGGPKPH